MRLSLKILFAGFVVTMAACGGQQSDMQSEMAPTDVSGPNIVGEEVAYTLDDVDFTGYLAYDANKEGKRPGVLVVHQWWGPSEYVRMRADMLAEMGYTAFALDMYGDGKYADHPEDAQKFVMEIVSNMDVAVARFEKAKRLLQAQPTTDSTKIAAIGYCFGGGVVLHMARVDPELAGVASFHGGLESGATAEAGKSAPAVLVLNGADDQWVTDEQIAAFEQEMAAAGVDLKFINYEGAVHGFTDPGATANGEKFDLPLAYNAEADTASWAELDAFLKEIF